MKNKNRFENPAGRIPDGCNKNRIKNRSRKYFFLLQAVFQATEKICKEIIYERYKIFMENLFLNS